MRAEFEKIVPDPGSSFTCRAFECERFSSPWHFHPEIELTLITASRGRRFVGDNIARFRPGDLVLLGPNLPHYWSNDPEPRGERASSVVVQFLEDFVGEDFLEAPELQGIRRLLRRAAHGVQFEGAAAKEAGARLSVLDKKRGLTRLTELLSILELLAASRKMRLLSSPRFAPLLNQFNATRINGVIEYINRDFRSDISHTAAARKAGLAPAAFSRFFRKMTGKTFTAFVNEIRVGEACRILIEEDANITEACFASGFRNVSNFNARFRGLKRMNPRAYRERFLAGQGGAAA